MNLPSFLEILISLAFTFLIVSLFVSGIWEFIATIIQDKRSRLLRQYLERLLSDEKFANLIYQHPLIRAQIARQKPQFLEKAFGWMIQRNVIPNTGEINTFPSYISPNLFAKVLLSVVRQHSVSGAPNPNLPPLPELYNIDNISQWINSLSKDSLGISPQAVDELKETLVTILQDAADTPAAISAIEKWFDSQMDRLSEYYKQYSQQGIRWVAIVVVVVFNLNVIHFTEHLNRDPLLRNLIAGQAEELVRSVGDSLNTTIARREFARQSIQRKFVADSLETGGDSSLYQIAKKSRDSVLLVINNSATLKIDSLQQHRTLLAGEMLGIQQLPFGLAAFKSEYSKPEPSSWLIIKTVCGWLLMIAAVSFGAPFWFDLLVKLVNIRNVGKIEKE
jgi:hypothetical protein